MKERKTLDEIRTDIINKCHEPITNDDGSTLVVDPSFYADLNSSEHIFVDIEVNKDSDDIFYNFTPPPSTFYLDKLNEEIEKKMKDSMLLSPEHLNGKMYETPEGYQKTMEEVKKKEETFKLWSTEGVKTGEMNLFSASEAAMVDQETEAERILASIRKRRAKKC